MKEVSDEEILNMIDDRATLEKGFRMLVETYQERLYWHVRRMVTYHEDADDVIQNTFVKAFKGLAGFKRESKLYTWLYRIATNEALNVLQQKKRHYTQAIDGAEYDLTERLKADVWFDGDEVQARLAAAVMTLPDVQRAVFNMKYHDEMKYADISQVMGTSVGALKASYHHAVKKIERYLKREEI